MKIPMNNKLWAMPENLAETVLRDMLLAGDDKAGDMTRPSSMNMGKCAVIDIAGALFSDAYWWAGCCYGDIRREIQAALDDDGVSSIMLNIDSPGGMVSGCADLAAFIENAAKIKPMAAYTSGMMASAAYWIGSATGKVYACQTAMAGSIGVIMTMGDYSKMLESAGITINVISSGSWKDAGSPYKAMTDEEREYFKSHVCAVHNVFLESVARNMNLAKEEKASWGDAQVFVSEEAVKHGLVTAVVKGLDEAITMLNLEGTMDRAQLEAQHPELLKAILAEGEAKAVAERSFNAESFLSCVKPFMTEDGFAKAKSFFDECSAAKLTAEQMAAVAKIAAMAAPASEKKEEEKNARAAILDGLQKAHQAAPLKAAEPFNRSAALIDAAKKM